MVIANAGDSLVYFAPAPFFLLVRPGHFDGVPRESSSGLGSPRPGSQVTETGWRAARARSLSHTIPLPPPSQGWEAERASNFAPIRSQPFSGSPCWATRPPRTKLEELCSVPPRSLGRRRAPLLLSRPLPLPLPPGPRPAGSAGDRTSPGRALCVCKLHSAARGCPTWAGAAAAAGAALGAAVLAGAGRCHASAARRAVASPSRYISAGEGTPGGVEDEGARARAPADCLPLPSPRPERSPRPPRTRLRRSSSWSSDRGGSCSGGGGGAGGASASRGGGSSGAAAAPAAMSCAEVMYHPQPYGAPQYLPNPVAAATCPTAYYHPAPQPGQQVSHRPGSLPARGRGRRRGARRVSV